MADLRIVDAPEIPTEDITGEEKLPTGGSGNYSISLDSLADYTKTKKDLADNTSVDGKVGGVRQELNAHIEDLLNPHQVTKGQIGLGNVDNTADADKPVSNSTQAAIISAVAPKADKTYVDNQLTLKANKTDVYTKQESSDLVNNSISTALTPVNSSLDLAKRGIANRYDSSLTYNSGERVVLTTSGDIVKSTINGNTNDPNVDMTGWIPSNIFASTVISAAALRLLTPLVNGQKAYLESHILDNSKGGGEFIATQKAGLSDNNGTVFGSPNPLLFWVRADQSNPLPEWFGAKGDGVADDASALTSYFAFMNTIQTEGKLIDNHLINSSVVISNTYGIDMSQGGKITVNADADGLVINNVARMSQFKNFRFAVNLPTASDKALMLVKVDSHIIGAVFDGFYVNDLTLSRTWTGRRFDSPTNAGKGIFGGTRIINTQAQGLKAATHFTNTNFFANGIYFGESFGSYNQDDVLVDRYLALSTFVNYQAQENTSSVVKFSDTSTTGNRNLFKNVHNWDNGLPSIVFSKGTAQNRWEMMYPFKVIDYGFDNAPVSSDLDTQDIRDNASATYLDILSVHNTLGDFRRLFNRETVTGTGVIKEGSGILANGKQRHSVILDVAAVNDTAVMTHFDSAALSGAVGRGFAERYSKTFFIAGFTLSSALVDDYSFLIGLSGIGTTDGTFYNGGVYLTCVGGNFVIVQTNNYSAGLPNAANCTVIATLKALDTKHHSIGIISNATGATGNQSVHFDNVWVVNHTQNITVSKSPVIANSFKATNKAALLVHKVQFKVLIGQGWI